LKRDTTGIGSIWHCNGNAAPAVGAVNQRTKAEVRAGAAQNPATSDNKQIESPKIPGVGR
jgi:hypothetical protein